MEAQGDRSLVVQEVAEARPLDELSSRELVQELAFEGQKLLHEELELAKAEIAGVGDRLKGAGISIAIGAACLSVALLVGAAAVVLLLDLIMPAWGAALMVFGLFLAIGVITLLEGISRVRGLVQKPKAVLDLVKADARWFEALFRHVRALRAA